MNIENLKYKGSKKINLTTNNSTPLKLKRLSYSNSSNSKQSKANNKNINIKINKLCNFNSINNTKNYIFNDYKLSPLIALLIYEKSISRLLEYIKKRVPRNIFVEFKKKYISFVFDELHVKNKNNILEKDIINVNIKLFITQKNSNFINYNKFMTNSLFKLDKKNKLKTEKISSFNSFNTELKNNNKSLTKIFYNTEENTNNKNEIKEKYCYKKNMNIIPQKNKRRKIIEHFRNISSVSGNTNSFNFTNKNKKENNKKIINKKREKKNIINDKKDEKINSMKQLNLIKENLEDNLKRMFNFSYGNFLNYEIESDSSKSLHDIYRFNNINNNEHFKQN